ncbi:polyphosphate--glucose phosphotransferase [Perlabentimonas gracilis]|uniref:polyphosphate--glucose phosphotransferase n=1 Tax=Perlabentimonas gracilis TaxID=2715279 RepID=UPI0014085C55|nr:ROK family protein [Perlabentimonas gracilis]NHB68161.1 ROK family protein [Perlabentimonas gracilis]
MEVLGIDVGGSAIKGAIVNTLTGELTAERFRIPTSQPATIDETVETVCKLVSHFSWKGKVGFGFPAVVQNGIVKTAANIDKGFIGVDINKLFSKATGCEVNVLNDADVAGYAELKFGAVKDFKGLAIFLTIGTGIGSALFSNGQLIPNSELGHIYLKNGKKGEHFTSDSARKREELDWVTWGKRFNKYLIYLEQLFYPELFIIGGGTSKKLDKFEMHLETNCRVEAATLLNNAGIVGAALLA